MSEITPTPATSGTVVLREEDLKDIPGLVFFGERIDGHPEFGYQAVFRFENGHGVSIIVGSGTYGVEAAYIRWSTADASAEDFQFHIDYEPPVSPETWTRGIRGWLNQVTLVATLDEVRAYPSRFAPKEIA